MRRRRSARAMAATAIACVALLVNGCISDVWAAPPGPSGLSRAWAGPPGVGGPVPDRW